MSETDLFPTLPPDFKHRPPLTNSEVEDIRKKLRKDGTAPAVIMLPNIGDDIINFLREQLKALGYGQSHFLRRVISEDRLNQAITTGSDRDSYSELNYHGSDDGEKIAMIENGLNPLVDASLTTYVADLNLEDPRPWPRPNITSFALLIYAPDAIQYIKPSKNRSGSYSNGFAMFKDRLLIEPSLLAVLSPIPQNEIVTQGNNNPVSSSDFRLSYYVPTLKRQPGKIY